MIAQFEKGSYRWSVLLIVLLAVLGSVAPTGGRTGEGDSSAIADLLPESLHRNLILYYSFDKNDGTKVVDISDMDFHGKVHGAEWIEEGVSGGAMSFDGEDDHIEIGEISLKAFTFSALVKVTDSEDSGGRYGTARSELRSNLGAAPMFFRRGPVGINNRRIFLLSGGGDQCYALQGNVGGSIGVYVVDDLEVNEYDWQFSSGVWTHVAVTHDGHTFKIYRNGKLTEKGGIETNGVSGTLYIGGTNERRGDFWCGDIDEVAIFNRALSDEEVKQVFGLTGSTNEMVMMPEPISLKRFAGEWTGLAVDKPEYGTSRDPLTLRLHIDREGRLYGEASGRFVRDGLDELKDLKVSGNRISFTIRHQFMGMLMAVTAELRGDELLGEGVPIDRDDDHCDITLRRVSREGPAEYTPPGRREYILYYSLDRDEGHTVKDESGEGNHGRVDGARYESNGMIGGAMSFNGSGDHIIVPDVYFEEFSFLVWIKTPLMRRSANNRRIFTIGDSINYYALQGNVGGGLSIVADGEEINEYDWQFEANKWTHITLTHGRGTFKLYKDGSLTETGQMASSPVGGSLYIGGTGRHRGSFWRGMMDEVTIFNRALNETEVKQSYDNQRYEAYGRPRRVSVQRPRPESAMGLERFAGVWSGMAIDKPEDGTSRDFLRLELQIHASGQLVGQAFGRFVHDNNGRLENIRVSGNQLYLEVWHRYQRMRMGITLTLEGDKLVGEGIPIGVDEDRCDITLEREPSARMNGRASGPVVVSARSNNTGASIVSTSNWHKNVVLYYSFEEADQSEVVDASGNGNHGRIRGTRYAEAQAGGKGMAFDGQDDCISIPGIHLQRFTFSAAVKPKRAGGLLNNQRLFLLDGDKGYYALQSNTSGTLGFSANIHGRKASIDEDNTQPLLEEWTIVAVTCDGFTVELYRNGELTGQGRILGDDVAGTAYIGGADVHNSRFWHGMIDEVALFNRPLASEEIRELCRITAVQELHHHLSAPEQKEFSDELTAVEVPEMNDDVVLYYSFNEDYGDEVLDNSGKGRHAHAHGTKYVSDGHSGRSLSFDGQDDYLSAREIHLDNFTFSAFVKTLLPANKPNTNNRRLFLLYNGPHYYALQGNSAGSIGLDVTGHRGVDEYSWKFEANTWTHIAVTYDRPVVKLYKNGKLTEAGSVDVDGVRGTLYIGGTEKHWGRYWHGLMDEVVIFNRALTQQEIEELSLMTGEPAALNSVTRTRIRRSL